MKVGRGGEKHCGTASPDGDLRLLVTIGLWSWSRPQGGRAKDSNFGPFGRFWPLPRHPISCACQAKHRTTYVSYLEESTGVSLYTHQIYPPVQVMSIHSSARQPSSRHRVGVGVSLPRRATLFSASPLPTKLAREDSGTHLLPSSDDSRYPNCNLVAARPVSRRRRRLSDCPHPPFRR